MTELETKMRGRVRTHLATVLATVALAVLVPVVVTAVAAVLSGGRPPEALLLLFPISFLAVPIAGIVSTARNLRCPACEGSVVWVAAWNQSLFAGSAARSCPHCSAQIFPSDQGRRIRPRLLVLFGAGVLLALGGALIQLLAR
ncbi:MAG: hypothetical protein J0L92_34895 [Deltaproteobacteria bacterium]|nr:hypothetical protein [Deltaproteobacteria bacterium]